MSKPNIPGAIVVLLAGTAALVGGQNYLDSKAPKPRPPEIRDVNGDGVEDLVVNNHPS